MKFSRLAGRKTCDRVRNSGHVWKGKTMIIKWIPIQDGMYVGTYAPGSLHKSSVKRNRMRRRCREALRLVLNERNHMPPTQLLLCPRIASLSVPFIDIFSDIQSFITFRLSHV